MTQSSLAQGIVTTVAGGLTLLAGAITLTCGIVGIVNHRQG
ncbi:hypothetical protein [Lacticaseibacillus kribbianus]|nr:hypothetical protein [Lacticaseibacillus kribbianus]